MNIKATILAAIFTLASSTTMARVIVQETERFEYDSLNFSETFSFNSFDSTLGTLTGVEFQLYFDRALENTVLNLGSEQSVGNPVPLTATTTLSISGSGGLFTTGSDLTTTLTTTGFSGVIDTGSVTVGAAADRGTIAAQATDVSFYVSNTPFSFEINLASFGTQGGSVPYGIYTGNQGWITGDAVLIYRYDEDRVVTEPMILPLLAIGLLGGLASVRRRRMTIH
jgi:hypothetical protein